MSHCCIAMTPRTSKQPILVTVGAAEESSTTGEYRPMKEATDADAVENAPLTGDAKAPDAQEDQPSKTKTSTKENTPVDLLEEDAKKETKKGRR